MENDADCEDSQPLASIIINNYNYAAYLGEAIESALSQGYSPKEVVVVDDGSTDDSRDVIAKYPTIISIMKHNGGQASALNAGFAASRGDIVVFLDADDVLLPTALSNAVAELDDRGVTNVRWPMWIIDAEGNNTGDTKPPQPPADGDLRDRLLAHGPSNVPCSPTSGNAWSRSYLQRVFPIPEEDFRLCADDYLYTLAPAFGRVRTIKQPLSCYRLHGRNNYSARTFNERLGIELANYDRQCSAIGAALERNNIAADLNAWKQHSWFHRLDRAISEIIQAVPEESHVVLVDAAAWDVGATLGSRCLSPFFAQDGADWGPPPDSDVAIAWFNSTQATDIEYFIIGWPSFWWFDEYPMFFQHLATTATCVHRSDVIAIYKLALTTSARLESHRFSAAIDGHRNAAR